MQWNSAYREAKALLILLIPQEDLLGRGLVLGEWLMGLNEERLAGLGGVEGVCVDAAVLQGQIPELVLGPEHVLVVAWPGSTRPAQSLAVQLPPTSEPFATMRDAAWKSPEHLAWNAQRLAAEAEVLDGALWPVLEPPPSGAREALADVARERWIQNPPPGAHWAHSGSCGVRVEAVDLRQTISCGMGHVDTLSTRLLYFVDISDRVLP